MRYTSQADAHLMRRRAMDPSILMRRRGFGALTQIGSGSTVSSAAAGASAGATIGSVVPIVGTAVGALIGGAVGAIASAFNRQDQEAQNFDQAQAISKANGASAVLNIQNKYLVLAGLFDLNASQIKGNIPFYKKYGRLGEYAFTVAMCNQVQAAANAGVINNNDTPQSVYSKVILPWINGMGYGAFSDSNAEMLGYIMMGMIAEYCAGIYTQRWYARGGDMPFGGLAPFTLPQAQQAAQPQVTASPTPSPVATNNAPAAISGLADASTELGKYQRGTVPAVGATVNYAFAGKSTMAFLQLPNPMTFVGVDLLTAAWIVSYQGQQYELNGNTLQPYTAPAPVQSTPVQTVATQVNATTTNSTGAAATDLSTGASIPTQYIASGSSAPVIYSQPTNSIQPVAASSGITPTEMAIGAAVLLGAVYLMTQKHAR
jgi:hypothetical protein